MLLTLRLPGQFKCFHLFYGIQNNETFLPMRVLIYVSVLIRQQSAC